MVMLVGTGGVGSPSLQGGGRGVGFRTMTAARISIPHEQIEAFCRKWKIMEFRFFGSVLRDDFGPESDIDVLVRFAPDAGHTLFDLAEMEE